MSVKIEQGKWYVLNDGQVVGPAQPNYNVLRDGGYVWDLQGSKLGNASKGWKDDGTFSADQVLNTKFAVKREATYREIFEVLRRRADMEAVRSIDIHGPGSPDTDKNVEFKTAAKNFGKTDRAAQEYLWLVLHYVLPDERTPIEKAADEVTDLAETMAEEAKEKDARIAELERKLANKQRHAEGLARVLQARDLRINELCDEAGKQAKRVAELAGKLKAAENRVFQYDVGNGYMRSMTAPHVEKELAGLQGQIAELKRDRDALQARKPADEFRWVAEKIYNAVKGEDLSNIGMSAFCRYSIQLDTNDLLKIAIALARRAS